MDRYEKALEQARNYYPDNLFLDTIFPELAESEDERIRKWLIELIKSTDTNHSNMKLSENCKLALAYLEKQKGQTPTHLEKTIAAYKLSDERSRDMMSSRMEGRQDVINNPEEYGLCKILEWSEEDERIRHSLIMDLGNAETDDEDVQKELDKQVAWLKSLRPQPHWKPSEEQMEELGKAKDMYMKSSSGIASLYYDLKTKLM